MSRVKVSQSVGLGSIGLITFSPVLFGVFPLYVVGKNLWLVAGVLGLSTWVLLVVLQSISKGITLQTSPRDLQLILAVLVLVGWGSAIVHLRAVRGVAEFDPSEFAYLLSPLLIVLWLRLVHPEVNDDMIIGLRFIGLVLVLLVLTLHVWLPLDVSGDGFILVGFTRQLTFQANSIGTVLVIFMVLETQVVKRPLSNFRIIALFQSLYLSAIFYVDSEASVFFGFCVYVWFFFAELRRGKKFGLLTITVALLLVLSARVGIHTRFLISARTDNQSALVNFDNGFRAPRAVDRVASGQGLLDSIRWREWIDLFSASASELFLGWDSRYFTHGNWQLLSSDFGPLFGGVFYFLFITYVVSRQKSIAAYSISAIFVLDSLVTSSFQHLYLCVFFAMISLSTDYLHKEAELSKS